jgi:hypothetical protein
VRGRSIFRLGIELEASVRRRAVFAVTLRLRHYPLEHLALWKL